MNKFYSSLVINGNRFPDIHQVLKPRYNKEFFKRLSANVEILDEQIKKRLKNFEHNYDLKNLKEDSRKYIKLKAKLENLRPEEDGDAIQEKLKQELCDLEDQLMPFATQIPNRSNKSLPEEEVILEEMKFEFQRKQNLFKVIDHRKLSFINNCYSKSVVGPNSHYYFNIGAKLQFGLSEYFTSELEKHDFIHLSGMSLVKSAIIEANNSSDLKNYTHDPCRILTDEPRCTTMHLVEASRESLTSFLTTLEPRGSNNPLRFMTSGAAYRSGSNWFDSDDKKVSQFETVHTLTVSPSIEQYSIKEYLETREIIWNIYKKLELPTRLVQCSLNSMNSNEYDASRIDIYLPSRQDWLPVARISHYLDFITVRLGLKRGHFIDCSAYDSQVLVAAIIENKQTTGGKFIIPSILKDHLTYLTSEEGQNYFESGSSSLDKSGSGSGPKVLNNFEQRRYKPRKNYLLGHSKEARRQNRSGTRRVLFSVFVFATLPLWIWDWHEIYRLYLPRWLQKFLWDYCYRVFWSINYKIALKNPPYIPKFEEFEPEYFTRTTMELRNEEFMEMDPRRRARVELQKLQKALGVKEPESSEQNEKSEK